MVLTTITHPVENFLIDFTNHFSSNLLWLPAPVLIAVVMIIIVTITNEQTNVLSRHRDLSSSNNNNKTPRQILLFELNEGKKKREKVMSDEYSNCQFIFMSSGERRKQMASICLLIRVLCADWTISNAELQTSQGPFSTRRKQLSVHFNRNRVFCLRHMKTH